LSSSLALALASPKAAKATGKKQRLPARKESLSPSLATTPRSSRWGSNAVVFNANFMQQKRGATIMLPSRGKANDAARVKNGGKAMGLPLHATAPGAIGDLRKGMLHVASAPILQSPTATSLHTSSPKTPRAARGLVRQVSKVMMHYPSCPVLQLPPRVDSPFEKEAKGISSSKRVTWADQSLKLQGSHEEWVETRTKLWSSMVLEDGTKTFELHRSERLCDGLFDIRRVARPERLSEVPLASSQDEGGGDSGAAGSLESTGASAPTTPEAQVAAATQEDEPGEALLHMTLRNLTDMEDDLLWLQEALSGGLVEIGACGGARHATAVMSQRTLDVVRRKASLLHDVEARTASLQSVHDRRGEVLPQIVAGTHKPPAELGGIKKFISLYTHHGPGEPVDGDRSDFAAFVKKFRLPSRHETLIRLRDLADEVGEWWAEACLSEAEKGHGHAVLARLFEVAIGTGVDKDHPKLIRARKIINDRLAERVLQEALERQENDKAMAENAPVPPVGPASAAADKIERDIASAIKEGVPKNDRRLLEAEKILKLLREADSQRKRLAGRQKRLEAEAKAKAAAG